MYKSSNHLRLLKLADIIAIMWHVQVGNMNQQCAFTRTHTTPTCVSYLILKCQTCWSILALDVSLLGLSFWKIQGNFTFSSLPLISEHYDDYASAKMHVKWSAAKLPAMDWTMVCRIVKLHSQTLSHIYKNVPKNNRPKLVIYLNPCVWKFKMFSSPLVCFMILLHTQLHFWLV